MTVMNVLRSVLCDRVLFCGYLLALASPVQAALIANSSVLYDEGLGDGRVAIFGAPANNGGTSTAGYTSGIVAGLAASGSASASYGALHANGFSAAVNPGQGLTAQTRGLGGAFWSDQLTFSSATSTGPAYARGIFSLSGGLSSLSDVGTIANSGIAARIQANGSDVFSTSGQVVSQGGTIVSNDVTRGQAVNGAFQIDPASNLTGSFLFDIPFQFGTPFEMAASLDAFTQALSGVAGNVSSAHSDFGSTGLWGGISEVHLADGTVLSGYSLSSISGFDWLRGFASDPVAVPAPGTAWLFGAGLLALVRVARRRKTA
jgi:hypothetical protein